MKGHGTGRKTVWLKKTCPKCGVHFEVNPALARVIYCSRRCVLLGKPSLNKGRRASPSTRMKQRFAKLGIRGKDHWNWVGAARSERKRAMARDEYLQWRTAVFSRDDYTCQLCGDRGRELNADHIVPWCVDPAGRFDINNGRALCVPCHSQLDTSPKLLIQAKELK